MKTLLKFLLFFTVINFYSQESVKDSLFFDYDLKYLIYSNNYENQHYIKFKTEQLVTSAFDNIQEDSFFYFSEVGESQKLKIASIERPLSLKNYLLSNPEKFLDKNTNKLDSYKIMKELDDHVVYFMFIDYFAEMKVLISLQE